jgi:hypothetical protein
VKVRYLGRKFCTVTHSVEHPALTRRNDRLKFGSANRVSFAALPLQAVRGMRIPWATGGTFDGHDFQRHDCPRDADAQSVDPVAAISASSNSTKTNVTTASEIVRRG